jgi:hypothetical protein
MPDRVFLQMWGPTRDHLVANHEFYVAEAKRRLLDQFDDDAMKADADAHADQWLAERPFNPERDDPGDGYEQAYDESISLSIIAGMFHEWEKQLRDWLGTELGHHGLGKHPHDAVWKAPIEDLFELFEICGWPVRDRPYFSDLNLCRLVTNVYKHGNGPSFDELKDLAPDLAGKAGDLPAFFVSALDYSSLSVVDTDLARFAEAITAFWRDVPENIFFSQIPEPPKWLLRALAKESAGRA